MINQLISIIIPTYNREYLIGETLDSIVSQTYKNWECIIVDDGSTDSSSGLISNYVQQDKRFRYFERPNNITKGANACRNIGIEKADGDYIIFFDSDDLMTANHIELKLKGLLNNDVDYVITRTKFFNSDLNYIDKYYQFDKYEITPINYISQKINWLTYDVCIKSSLAKSIQFNENLQSGQEYNYFSKLVLKSTKAIFIDEVVTLRRHHENSIRSNIKTKSELNLGYFRSNWYTYLDVINFGNKSVRLVLLKRCIILIYDERRILTKNKFLFIKSVFKEFKLRAFYFLLMLFFRFFNKGFSFKKKLLKEI